MSIKVHVHGALGRMGSTVVAAVAEAPDMELCGSTDKDDDLVAALAKSQPQVVVEFTIPEAVEANVRSILDAGIHVVAGTTGLAADKAAELGQLAQEKGVGFLLAPNFAIGVLLMQRFAREAVKSFPDVEILELHHQMKLDAPSGTAIHTASLIAETAARHDLQLNAQRLAETEILPGSRGGCKDQIPIHSVRLPGLLAHQEVMFGGPGQVLTIRHDAMDRRAFMPGVLLGIRQILSRKGLWDSLEHFL